MIAALPDAREAPRSSVEEDGDSVTASHYAQVYIALLLGGLGDLRDLLSSI